MFIKKTDKIDDYNNQIKLAKNEILELTRKLESKKEELNNISNEKRDYGIHKYLSKEYRVSLLSQAKALGYSIQIIEKLEQYVEEWNQDVITDDIIDSFKIIEEFIKNKQEPYKDSIVYKIGKFFDCNGGNGNEN